MSQLECPNCCSSEWLEISIEESTVYRVMYDPETNTHTLKEKGKEDINATPTVWCKECGDICDVPKEFFPPFGEVEYA